MPLLHDRFVLSRRLGAGGMGVVFAAHDRERDEVVALKTLHNRDAAALYRFKKEFRTLAGVAHPNLVSLYELIATDEVCFFTMELVDGDNFLHYVRPEVEPTPLPRKSLTATIPLTTPPIAASPTRARRPTPLPSTAGAANQARLRPATGPGFDEGRLRAALRQLGLGVAAIHRAGKLHRDLKPHNVLVTHGGDDRTPTRPTSRVVILDFGIATELSPPLDQMSIDDRMAGTVAYMAPEQCSDDPCTPASDWYAVGVMLFEALTGLLPFVGPVFKVVRDKVHSAAPSPAALVLGLPADLVELCEDLLATDPAARPSEADILDRLGSGTGETYRGMQAETPAGALVGRHEHLEALARAFRETQRGKAIAVCVHGVSGVGKTAIVQSFLRITIDQVWTGRRPKVLPGRCYERELVPYKALDGLIDALSRLLVALPVSETRASLPRDSRALARLFPVLDRVPAIAQAPRRGRRHLDRWTQRRLAFTALRELLARLADRWPLVLTIDDLQWADSDSIALLRDLLRPPDPPPILVIASFRREEIDSRPFLAELLALTDGEGFRQLPIEPLTASEAAELARALLPRDLGLEPLIEHIVREGQGSPFLIERLAAHAVALRGADAGTSLERDLTLARMIDLHLHHLPEGSAILLSTLTEAARPIDAAVAYRAAGLVGDERRLVAELEAARLVRASTRTGWVEIYHDRVRESLAERIDASEARRIHRRLAEALRHRGFDDPEALFNHRHAAGDREQAASEAIRAARKAADALAFDHAAKFHRRALELGRFNEAERLELTRALADSLLNAGRSAEAAASYRSLARATPGIEGLRYRSRAAEVYLAGGDFDRGVSELQTVLGALGMPMASSPAMAMARLLWLRLRVRLRGLGTEPREVWQIPERTLLEIDTCWMAASTLVLVDPVLGASFQTRHLLLALDTGEPRRVARALCTEATYYATAGHSARQRTRGLLDRASDLIGEIDDSLTTGLGRLYEGLAAYCFGEWQLASEHLDTAESIFTDRCIGALWEVTIARRFALATLMFRGQLTEASYRSSAYLAEADERGNVVAATYLRIRLSILKLADDDTAGCHLEIDEAMDAWTQQGFQTIHAFALFSRCEADLYAGDGECAWRRLLEHWPRLTRSLVIRYQVTRIEAHFLRARCALAAGSRTGRRAAEHAAMRLAREATPYATSMAELVGAGLAEADGSIDRARELLLSAERGLEAADMGLFAAAARRRRGELTGGSSGMAVVTAADAWMKRQSIQHGKRMAAMLVPGHPGHLDHDAF